MKFIYYTNNIVFGLTLLAFITPILGMMMQFILGGIQVLLFIILLFNIGKFSKIMKTHLVIYAISAIIFLIWFSIKQSYFDELLVLIIFIPMAIATYFTYIVYQLKNRVS